MKKKNKLTLQRECPGKITLQYGYYGCFESVTTNTLLSMLTLKAA